MSRPVPNPGILDIAPYTPGKSPVPEPGRKVFKLSANETPFGPSPKAMEAYRTAVTHLEDYPEGTSRVLRNAIGRAFGLDPDRIMGVETGGCPHTAIREDASINLAAVDEMRRKFTGLDLILIESGGDNLAATFSPDLADLTLYVISVAEGEKIPRKGGPAISRSDLLIINKADLAPYVNASLEIMASDTQKVRDGRPYVFTDLLRRDGLEEVIAFIEKAGGLLEPVAAE